MKSFTRCYGSFASRETLAQSEHPTSIVGNATVSLRFGAFNASGLVAGGETRQRLKRQKEKNPLQNSHGIENCSSILETV